MNVGVTADAVESRRFAGSCLDDTAPISSSTTFGPGAKPCLILTRRVIYPPGKS